MEEPSKINHPESVGGKFYKGQRLSLATGKWLSCFEDNLMGLLLLQHSKQSVQDIAHKQWTSKHSLISNIF